MKYNVKFSCGHEQEIQLFGPTKERERKIQYYEDYGMCSDCYNKKQDKENSKGCEAVDMFYGDYKEKYSKCKTKRDSYNPETKTIVVFVPEGE